MRPSLECAAAAQGRAGSQLGTASELQAKGIFQLLKIQIMCCARAFDSVTCLRMRMSTRDFGGTAREQKRNGWESMG